jgi:hypothetical protein
MNVCNVESINCALTPKSHNFISPIEKKLFFSDYFPVFLP